MLSLPNLSRFIFLFRSPLLLLQLVASISIESFFLILITKPFVVFLFTTTFSFILQLTYSISTFIIFFFAIIKPLISLIIVPLPIEFVIIILFFLVILVVLFPHSVFVFSLISSASIIFISKFNLINLLIVIQKSQSFISFYG